MATKIIEFNTQRLRLRQWGLANWEPYGVLSTAPRVVAFFPSILNRAASDEMAERNQRSNR